MTVYRCTTCHSQPTRLAVLFTIPSIQSHSSAHNKYNIKTLKLFMQCHYILLHFWSLLLYHHKMVPQYTLTYSLDQNQLNMDSSHTNNVQILLKHHCHEQSPTFLIMININSKTAYSKELTNILVAFVKRNSYIEIIEIFSLQNHVAIRKISFAIHWYTLAINNQCKSASNNLKVLQPSLENCCLQWVFN